MCVYLPEESADSPRWSPPPPPPLFRMFLGTFFFVVDMGVCNMVVLGVVLFDMFRLFASFAFRGLFLPILWPLICHWPIC